MVSLERARRIAACRRLPRARPVGSSSATGTRPRGRARWALWAFGRMRSS